MSDCTARHPDTGAVCRRQGRHSRHAAGYGEDFEVWDNDDFAPKGSPGNPLTSSDVDQILTATRPGAPVRHSDPGTSHAAAATITRAALTSSQTEVYRILAEHGPLIHEDLVVLAEATGHAEQRLRTATKELCDLGIVGDTGERGITRRGRPAIRWGIAVSISD